MKGLYTSNEKRCFFFREFRFIQEKIRFILLVGNRQFCLNLNSF